MLKKTGDFFAAFLIGTSVLFCIALVSQADFFEHALKWDGEEYSLEIFDSTFVLDRDIPKKLDALVSVNDMLFFDGFSSCIKKTAECTFDYVKDLLSIAFTAVKEVTGTR